jgi:catechol 2,3-dioxygenase-like lactoylglutathione lyase family enzyme
MSSSQITPVVPDQRSAVVTGFGHVAQITCDLDRLVRFYREVFDVPFVELPGPDARHGFLLLGTGPHPGDLGAMLHVFEMSEDITGPMPPADVMFRRGRLDHIAIEAADEPALELLRDRLVACGASDGVVRVFGGRFLSIHLVDPDGMHLEVGCAWRRERFGDADVVLAHEG